MCTTKYQCADLRTKSGVQKEALVEMKETIYEYLGMIPMTAMGPRPPSQVWTLFSIENGILAIQNGILASVLDILDEKFRGYMLVLCQKLHI